MIFMTSAQAFALDSINLPAETISGKFEMISDGLIIIDEKGVKKNFIRKEDRFNIYSDYITYKISPLSSKTESTPCRVIFLDKFIVKFKTPNSNVVEMQRYRVKNLDINIR